MCYLGHLCVYVNMFNEDNELVHLYFFCIFFKNNFTITFTEDDTAGLVIQNEINDTYFKFTNHFNDYV